jgi:hypothetical protein
MASCLFAFDLLKNNINCTKLSDKIIINENNRNLRNPLFLKECFNKDNFLYNDTINTAIRNFNKYKNVFNLDISRKAFKLRILNLIKKL